MKITIYSKKFNNSFTFYTKSDFSYIYLESTDDGYLNKQIFDRGFYGSSVHGDDDDRKLRNICWNWINKNWN